jgi:hypothetical protein
MKKPRIEKHKQVRELKTEDKKPFLILCPPSSALCLLIFILCLLISTSGCLEINAEQTNLSEQIDKLNEQNLQLQKQLEQKKNENKELRDQVQVLSDLPVGVKGENLYHLQSIKIGHYTNLYDKNEDGKKERLIVYIQPIDEDGDIIKAAGSVDVQLWDLSKAQDRALLCEGKVQPEEIKKHWVSGLLTNYRLEFDVTGKIDEIKDPLTVKVTFTDYLTGKVFEEQKVIEPR